MELNKNTLDTLLNIINNKQDPPTKEAPKQWTPQSIFEGKKVIKTTPEWVKREEEEKLKNKDKRNYDYSTEQDVKKYLKNYYLSNFFKNNLLKSQQGWSLGQAANFDPQVMANAVDNAKINFINGGQSKNYQDGKIDISKTQFQNAVGSLPLAHELGHENESYVLGRSPSNVYMMLKNNSLFNSPLTEAEKKSSPELKKYRDDIRYLHNGTLNLRMERMRRGNEEMKNIEKNVKTKPKWDWGWQEKNFAEGKNDLSSTTYNAASSDSERFHDDNPNEIRADILAIRYLAQKNKIWDPVKNPNEPLTDEKFKQIMNMPELNNDYSQKLLERPELNGSNFMKQRLKIRFDDKELKELLEKVAINNKRPSGLYNNNNA